MQKNKTWKKSLPLKSHFLFSYFLEEIHLYCWFQNIQNFDIFRFKFSCIYFIPFNFQHKVVFIEYCCEKKTYFLTFVNHGLYQHYGKLRFLLGMIKNSKFWNLHLRPENFQIFLVFHFLNSILHQFLRISPLWTFWLFGVRRWDLARISPTHEIWNFCKKFWSWPTSPRALVPNSALVSQKSRFFQKWAIFKVPPSARMMARTP